jgi:hypothetical protein
MRFVKPWDQLEVSQHSGENAMTPVELWKEGNPCSKLDTPPRHISYRSHKPKIAVDTIDS